MYQPTSVDTLGATAGLSGSAGNTVGQANRGTRQFNSVEAIGYRRCMAAHDGPIRLDALAGCGRWLALGVGLLLTLLASQTGTAEYVGSLLLSVAGLMCSYSEAGDLVLLFVGLELISIPTYILLNLGRRDAACRESAAKFFLSVLASAILLYGFSFIYGAAGSTDLSRIRTALESGRIAAQRFGGVCPAGLRV